MSKNFSNEIELEKSIEDEVERRIQIRVAPVVRAIREILDALPVHLVGVVHSALDQLKIPPPILTDAEQVIIEAMEDQVLRGPEIAKRAGYTYGTVRQCLPRLIRRGIVERVQGGYRVKPQPEI